MITIPKQRYTELVECEEVDRELISDIARGINDLPHGKIKEI